MIDRVYGRDLPDMRDWGQALLDEAIRCKVQFGVLVLGQGMVTARLLRATPSAKMVLVHVTHDPRGWMADVEYPAEMRYVSEIRQAGSGFSLMRPQRQPGHNTATVAAARRLLARAKSAARPDQSSNQWDAGFGRIRYDSARSCRRPPGGEGRKNGACEAFGAADPAFCGSHPAPGLSACPEPVVCVPSPRTVF